MNEDPAPLVGVPRADNRLPARSPRCSVRAASACRA